MALKMHPGDFNPLDVLATAASLQTQVNADGEGAGSGAEGSQVTGTGDSTESEDPASRRPSIVSKTVCVNGNADPDATPPKSKATNVYKIHVKRLSSSSAEDVTINNNRASRQSINPASSCIVKVVTKKANGERIVAPLALETSGSQGDCIGNNKRKVTVLQIAKQGVDHSYCSAGPLDRSRSEDDEGYASRSSMDSPGQLKTDCDCDQNSSTFRHNSLTSPVTVRSPGLSTPILDMASPQSVDSETSETVKSPSILLPQVFSPPLPPPPHPPTQQTNSAAATISQQGAAQAGRKPTKIVIMSRDTDIQKCISAGADCKGHVISPTIAATSPTSCGQNVMLRSLLGQAKKNATPTAVSRPITQLVKVQPKQVQDPEIQTENTALTTAARSATPQAVSEKSPQDEIGQCNITAGSQAEDCAAQRQVRAQQSDDSCAACTSQQASDISENGQLGRSLDMASSSSCLETDVKAPAPAAEIREAPSEDVALSATRSPDSNDNKPSQSPDNVTNKTECYGDAEEKTSDGTNEKTAQCDTASKEATPKSSSSSSQTVHGGNSKLPVITDSLPGQATSMKYMLAGTDSQNKMVLLPLARNKYIIEDDIPPISTLGQQQRPLGSPSVAVVSPAAGKNPTVAIPTSLVAVPSLQSGPLLRSPTPALLGNGEQLVSLQRGIPGPISIVQQYGSPANKNKLSLSTSPPLKVTAVGSATQTKAAIIPGSSKVLARSQSSAITLVEKKVVPGIPANNSTLHRIVLPITATATMSDIPVSFSISDSIANSSNLTVLSTTTTTAAASIAAASSESTDASSKADAAATEATPSEPSQEVFSDEHSAMETLENSENVVDGEGREDSHDGELELFEKSVSSMASSTDGSVDDSQDLNSPLSTAGITSGRLTPLEPLETSPSDKINIKISGSKVIDVSGIGESSTTTRKATTSIGTVGSLSWTSLGSLAKQTSGDADSLPGGTTVLTTGGAVPSLYMLQNGVQKAPRAKTGTPPRSHSDSALSALVSKLAQRTQRQQKSTDDDRPRDCAEMSARTCHSYVKKKNRSSLLPVQSILDLTRMKQSAQLISRLHPVIDHDYCTFAEFSAEIQSSIIATTETKLKNERKYAKKAKAARTKAVRSLAPSDKTGRVKRKYVRRKLLTNRRSSASVANTSTSSPVSPASTASGPSSIEISKEVEAEIGADAMEQLREKRKYVRGGAEKKIKIRSARLREKSDKNYVKITGSYQDEFVYFTTKKTRGRPRKSIDPTDLNQAPTKIQAVGGLSVFDWYQDLSKADKGSRFGVSGIGTPENSDAKIGASPSHAGPGATPLHDSDVVDLVMDMTLPEPSPAEDDAKAFNGLILEPTAEAGKVEEEVVVSSSEEPISEIEPKMLGNDATLSPADFADQVRFMLNSMGDAGLKLLEDLGEPDSDAQSTSAAVPEPSEKVDLEENPPVSSALKEEMPSKHDAETSLNSLNALLTSYSQEGPNVPQLQTTPNHQLLDLDDINDSDLIQPDLPGMNMIISDLKSTTTSSSTWTDAKVSNSGFTDPSASPMKQYLDNDLVGSGATGTTEAQGFGFNFGKPLDKAELFPDMTPVESSSNTSLQDSAVPELTTVSMYWNDLPGLIINGKQYVRLVDIHKQVLPAKDTGILKKRCQMMGLDIINCTELQRDFLIRYANAAKSKSTVVAPKEAAQTLIGFYVDPRPRVTKQASQGESKEDAEGKTNDTPSPAAGEPKTNNEGASERDPNCDKKTPSGEQPDKPTEATSEDMEAKKRQTSTKSSPTVSKAKSSQPSRKRKASGESTSKEETKLPLSKDSPTSLPARTPVHDVKRSDRLKNRRVQYAAMVQGNFDGLEETSPKASKHSAQPQEGVNDSNSENNEESASETKPVPFPEEIEIRILRNRQKKRPLGKKEKKKLKRLRERLRMKVGSRRRLKKLAKQQPKQDKPQKAKQRLKEKHLNGSKYEQEHCYAAHPTPDAAAKQKLLQNGDTNVVVEEGVVSMDHVPEDKTESPEPVEQSVPKKPEANRVLKVLHRNGHRGRGQEGSLSLRRFRTKEAACIECTTCQEFFSVRRFLKHMHKQNNPDEVMEVPLQQKLEILSRSPTDEESATWGEFLERRQDFERQAIANRRGSKAGKQEASSDGSPRKGAKSEPLSSKNSSQDSDIKAKSGSQTKSETLLSPQDGDEDIGDSCLKEKRLKEGEQRAKSETHSNTSVDSVEDFQKLSSDFSPDPNDDDHKCSRRPSFGDTGNKRNSLHSRRNNIAKTETVDETAAGTRHSTRVRKRKQLHPMESYVFSSSAVASDRVPSKRTRHETGLMREDVKQRERS